MISYLFRRNPRGKSSLVKSWRKEYIPVKSLILIFLEHCKWYKAKQKEEYAKKRRKEEEKDNDQTKELLADPELLNIYSTYKAQDSGKQQDKSKELDTEINDIELN